MFSEKARLIFEYNRRTPLFVRVANNEIEKNNVDYAIEILTDGLKIYSNYSAAYLLLGKALTLTGNYGLALKNIRIGSNLIHSPKTYEYYIKEIENIKRQRSVFDSNKNKIFFPGEEDLNQQDLFNDTNFDEIEDIDEIDIDKDFLESRSIDNRIEELAREISAAKLKYFNDEDEDKVKEEQEAEKEIDENDTHYEDFYEGHLIVSDTLAKIYATQGEVKEAINVYKKLIEKNPTKKNYYEDQIKKLETENS